MIGQRSGDPDPRYLLHIYLRDHQAASKGGISLVRRCRRSNSGTELAVVLEGIEAEIRAAQQALEDLMRGLGAKKSRVKQVVGRGAEVVGRLKSNGRLFHYSPLSRVVELEALASAVFTQRSLWLSLRAVVDHYAVLDAGQLDRLIADATGQYERLLIEHDRAAAVAFGSTPGHVVHEAA
ncbi:MAG: hypothetical protein QOE00_2705 [Ilumatobacteraceae bacterium]|jgi:hypothetical protein